MVLSILIGVFVTFTITSLVICFVLIRKIMVKLGMVSDEKIAKKNKKL